MRSKIQRGSFWEGAPPRLPRSSQAQPLHMAQVRNSLFRIAHIQEAMLKAA